MTIIEHHLPGEGINTSWFAKLNDFERQETARQVKFKRRRWPGIKDGSHSKYPDHTYPHILPPGQLQDAFYPPIAQKVIGYCGKDVAIHSEALNLRSSQVCCFNVMFPLRENFTLAAIILAPVLQGVRTVSRIEFEYTGSNETTEWLGEPSQGKRGQNRTSIDVAIWWEDGRRKVLTLAEWKYTERNYGTCGGCASKGNTNAAHCRTVSYPACVNGCYLAQPRNHRLYWEHLAEAGIDGTQLANIQGCPFRGPFYQIWRQYLVAASCRKHLHSVNDQVDDVDVVLLDFPDNKSLHQCPSELSPLGSATVIDAWNRILVGNAPLRRVAVKEIIDRFRRAANTGNDEWLMYLNDRYGL